MTIQFHKYQGTGNDFILIDNRSSQFPKNDTKRIASFCNRRFGIGADGLILLEEDKLSDFKMVYFNADGNEGSLCGNGGRCTVAFAKYLGIITANATFKAADGLHRATISDGIVKLQMQDVSEIKQKPDYLFLNTGSPHHVQMVQNLKDFNVYQEGKKLRYGMYGKAGSNINFIEPLGDGSFGIRTYERGVEDETLSCGTGVTAAALALYSIGKTNEEKVMLKTQGGELTVTFNKKGDTFENIYLIGPASLVFKGEIEC